MDQIIETSTLTGINLSLRCWLPGVSSEPGLNGWLPGVSSEPRLNSWLPGVSSESGLNGLLWFPDIISNQSCLSCL